MAGAIDMVNIQQLQFSDLPGAEALAHTWLEQALGVTIDSVKLRPSAVSLNSFNGLVIIDGEAMYFKSHTEPASIITEYYNCQILHDAGYNTVLPLRRVQQEGSQIALYPLVHWPVVFDLVRKFESFESFSSRALIIAAEADSCDRLLEIYRNTAELSSAVEHGSAPVHQLFWHRLTAGRFDQFYRGSSIDFPEGQTISMDRLLELPWTINGIAQPRTLGTLINEAQHVLRPDQASLTVVGHGDAHFGNVFLEDGDRYLYFDPAFAGRHNPLLDIVKPLFHNVFARWLYFPHEVANELTLTVDSAGDRLVVDYTPFLSEYRHELLQTKQERLVEPLLTWLASQDALPHGRRVMELALMCCPLLTMNLCDKAKFPTSISWLGFALAIQMGNWDVSQQLY